MANTNSWQKRLNARRHKGESAYSKDRGPNTGAWENTYIPIRRYQGFQTGVSSWGGTRVGMKGPY